MTSFSKYFGATGWRNAVIALHEDNIYDKMIARLSEEQKAILNKRYSSIDLHPEKLKFIDRMVADSRQIALNPSLLHRNIWRKNKRKEYCEAIPPLMTGNEV